MAWCTIKNLWRNSRRVGLRPEFGILFVAISLQSAQSVVIEVKQYIQLSGPTFSYKVRNIVGFRLVEMAISTASKPTIYRNENPGPAMHDNGG